jgi:3-oxoacyl-[acyl-carrier protein] reductase
LRAPFLIETTKMPDFTDKVAIVTGSATGLGASTAVKLAQGGARLILNYTKSRVECEATAHACAEAGSPEVRIEQGDVSDDAACINIVNAAKDWGRVDILVNNAGMTKHVPKHADMDGLTSEDFQRLYAVNTIGPFLMIRAARELMLAAFAQTGQASSVVMISSIAGVTGIGSSVAYAATKGALNTMTLSLARALAPAIRINAVCPGFIDTRWFTDQYGDETTAKIRANIIEQVPLRVASGPDDVAESVVFFCSSAARHITGETLLVDAGHHLGFAPLVAR